MLADVCMNQTSERFLSYLAPGRQNVGELERWASVVAGTAIAAFGLSRRNAGGTAAALIGGALVWRGATGHCPVYDSLGMSTAGLEKRQVSVPYGKGIRVEESVTVAASPDRVYGFWRNLENLPRFMRHLESVEQFDGNRSHWTAKGPAGIDAHWDAEIINEIPNELIGWRSVADANVANAGSVHFTPTVGGGTEIRVVLRYDPPGGAVGDAFLRLFGEDPAAQIADDLGRLAALLNEGTPSAATQS
jgi:uncharacterized membrane protein